MRRATIKKRIQRLYKSRVTQREEKGDNEGSEYRGYTNQGYDRGKRRAIIEKRRTRRRKRRRRTRRRRRRRRSGERGGREGGGPDG